MKISKLLYIAPGLLEIIGTWITLKSSRVMQSSGLSVSSTTGHRVTVIQLKG